MKHRLLLLAAFLLPPLIFWGQTITGEQRTWHRIAITLASADVFTETGTPNPFTDMRLTVTFTGPDGRVVRVPGHFAADGDAGESGATQGNIWRVYFAPDTAGLWTWQASCRQGPGVAIDTAATAGSAYPSLSSQSGSLTVLPTNKNGPDNRAKGRLVYNGTKYRSHRGNGEHVINVGADAPENLLAYYEFDQTSDDGGNNYDLTSTNTYKPGFAYAGDGLHHYAAHVADWQPGDPTWHGTKGKGIIGAVNYLHSEGLNAFSGLLWNVGGDGDDVWPFIIDNNRNRIDVSKMDQWEVVFDHADRLGMIFHAKLFETENDQDMSTDEWKLYFREMVSRFGHHLAWEWNLGEENTMPAQHIRDQAHYLRYLHPYGHDAHVVLHTYPANNWRDAQWLPQLGDPTTLTGISIQDGPNDIEGILDNWIPASDAAGHPWVANWDEQNGASTGVSPDQGYPGAGSYNHPTMRQAMWIGLIQGMEGMKCYFGYSLVHNDIDCEDFRSRDAWWDQMRIAREVMAEVPFWNMHYAPGDDPSNDNYVLTDGADYWLVYASDGDNVDVTFPPGSDVYETWLYRVADGLMHYGGTFNPASNGGSWPIIIGFATPADWAVVIKRQGAGSQLALFWPEEEAARPELEDGYWYLDHTPTLPHYRVYDITGRIVHTGEVDGNRFELYPHPGLWVYQGWDFRFVHGVR